MNRGRVDGGYQGNEPAPRENDAADLSAARKDWEASVVANHLLAKQLMPFRADQSFEFEPGAVPDAVARARAFIQAHTASAPVPAVNLPSVANIELIRLTIADGLIPAEIAAGVGRTVQEIVASLLQVENAFNIQSPQDWLPVLGSLFAAQHLSPAECGRAIVNLSAKPGFGPAEPWQELAGRLGRAGLPADEAGLVRWNLQCSAHGINRDERALLVTLAGAEGALVPSRDVSAATKSVQAGLDAKLASHAARDALEQRASIVAKSAWLGVLPPGSDARTVAACCMHVNARKLGLRLSTAQTALLLDLREGRSEPELITLHGEDYTLTAGKMWERLRVPDHWMGAHQAGPMIDRATELGLFDIGSVPAAPATPAVIDLYLPHAAGGRAPTSGAAPVLNGQIIGADVIAAAPSLQPDEVELFKTWQVEKMPLGSKEGFHKERNERLSFIDSLGRPDPQMRLAIAAKACNEGKLTEDELFTVQQSITAEVLSLSQSSIDVLEPLAAGCLIPEMNTWLGTSGASQRLSTLARALGVAGSYERVEVRQKIVEAAFAAGLLRESVTIPLTPPENIQLAAGRVAKERPDLSQTAVSRPLSEEELTRAPSLSPEYRTSFKNLTVSDMFDRQWDKNANLKRQMMATLGDPSPREMAAIATKARDEGILTDDELRRAVRWTVLQTCGLTKAEAKTLDALAAGLSVAEVAQTLGVRPQAITKVLARVAALFEPPLSIRTPSALASAMPEIVRAGLVIPGVPQPVRAPLEPLSRQEIDGAPVITEEFIQFFKDWRVNDLPHSERNVSSAQHNTERTKFNTRYDFPQDRTIIAMAAKATEGGQLTAAEFVKVKRLIAAAAIGMTRQEVIMLDALNAAGSFDGAVAMSNLPRQVAGDRIRKIKVAIGLSGTIHAPNAVANLLRAAFERGLLLTKPEP